MAFLSVHTLYLARKYGPALIKGIVADYMLNDIMETLQAETKRSKEQELPTQDAKNLGERYDEFVNFIGAYLTEVQLFNLNQYILSNDKYGQLVDNTPFVIHINEGSCLAKSFLAYEARKYGFAKNKLEKLLYEKINEKNESDKEIIKQNEEKFCRKFLAELGELPQTTLSHYRFFILPRILQSENVTPEALDSPRVASGVMKSILFHIVNSVFNYDIRKVKLLHQPIDNADGKESETIFERFLKRMALLPRCDFSKIENSFVEQLRRTLTEQFYRPASNLPQQVTAKVTKLNQDIRRQVNAQATTFSKVLHHAVQHKDLSLIECLIGLVSQEVDDLTVVSSQHSSTYLLVNTVDEENGDTPLHIAVKKGQLNTVRLLLQPAVTDVNIQNKAGNTPLHEAAKADHTEIARLLVLNGADLTMKNKEKRTPQIIAEKLKHESTLKVIKTEGRNVMRHCLTQLSRLQNRITCIELENDLLNQQLRHQDMAATAVSQPGQSLLLRQRVPSVIDIVPSKTTGSTQAETNEQEVAQPH